jgi:hypothetical protein
MKSKFESLDKTELVKKCLEQEDELEKLRPKPPKFKVGQVLAFPSKPQWTGQPAAYFSVLRIERRPDGGWGYAYSVGLQGSGAFYPENKLRPLSSIELEGIELEGIPSAEPTSASTAEEELPF